jgi:hypothetical protein
VKHLTAFLGGLVFSVYLARAAIPLFSLAWFAWTLSFAFAWVFLLNWAFPRKA